MCTSKNGRVSSAGISTYSWKPPQPGRVKINVDASFYKETNIAGLGIIARDEKGNVILATTKVQLTVLMLRRLNYLPAGRLFS